MKKKKYKLEISIQFNYPLFIRCNFGLIFNIDLILRMGNFQLKLFLT